MDNSEDLLCRFGTPLDPLEEDDIPSKKPVAIEDQIVTDENGKRRFHGAFTGGFSAGFWNTVGSLEGWKPQSFKSSRSEKAQKRQRQLPTDFMDDEDLGEFGIAPQRVQAREDFAKNDSSNRKRKLLHRDSGQIPGIPILQQLETGREKVAVRLLRRMGWKPGQGIGARQTRIEKTRSTQQNIKELYLMQKYGYEMDPSKKMVRSAEETSNISDSGEEEEDVTFAPDDFEPFVCIIKDNTFGLGYSGLSRQFVNDSRSHINLFTPLEVLGKSNNVLSITGQAFGVGALEEDDEDIYARDDMSRYDFTLESRNSEKRKLTSVQVQSVLEGFAEASYNTNVQKKVHGLELKSNFQPRNWLQRKTRFEILPEEKRALLKQSDTYKIRGLGRHDLDSDERRKLLGDHKNRSTEIKSSNEPDVKKQPYLHHISEKYAERCAKNKNISQLLSSNADSFVKGGLITKGGIEIPSVENELSEAIKTENCQVVSKAKEITKSLGEKFVLKDSSCEIFRPFINNEAKQKRYEQFIGANLKKEEAVKAFLNSIQPVHLSEWDKEMECKEFIQARNIYKPLSGLMSERFISKSNANVATELPKIIQDEKTKVVVQRTKTLWKACALICKRFNIAEQLGGTQAELKTKKKNKFSVFDYIEGSINSKQDFVTPVIIPKQFGIPRVTQIQQGNLASSKEKISTNELPDKGTGPSTSNICYKENSIQTQITTNLKTDLELRVEKSKNIHPSEKKDLFKCIFDSSDDELQGDRTADNQKCTVKPIVSDEIAKSLIKPSVPINILRHNSPPRGIFAALFSNPLQKEGLTEPSKSKSPQLDKIIFKPKHDRDVEQIMELGDTYGPKLPSKLVTASNTPVDNEIDRKLIELLSSKSKKATKVIDTWIEKTDESRKNSKEGKKKKKTKNRKEKTKIKVKKSKKNKRNKT